VIIGKVDRSGGCHVAPESTSSGWLLWSLVGVLWLRRRTRSGSRLV
jgi:MYXO-CTERM domain-containing protein